MPSRPDPSLVSNDPERAIACLVAGGLVALPTETVYGLAARAEDPAAVRRVYAIKERPLDHPVIVHLAEADDLDAWVAEISPSARRLIDTCWPGPLTVLLRRSARVIDEITGGRPTVAVRVPAHPLTRRVIAGAGAVIAPSANVFGRVSPTTAEHVLDDLGDRLDPGRDLILDGGPCRVGVESTIVDCTRDPAEVLRPGGIATEEIVRLLGEVGTASGPARASGMLAAHYAPRARVVLVEVDDPADVGVDGERIVLIDRCDDLVVYARDLYGLLRDADRRGAETIVARLPPATGLGHAIRDRLQKAAATTGGSREGGSGDPSAEAEP